VLGGMTMDSGRLKLCSVMWRRAGSIYVLEKANKKVTSLSAPDTDAGARERATVVR